MTGSRALKKIPPMPVTLFISASVAWVRVTAGVFRGLTFGINESFVPQQGSFLVDRVVGFNDLAMPMLSVNSVLLRLFTAIIRRSSSLVKPRLKPHESGLTGR